MLIHFSQSSTTILRGPKLRTIHLTAKLPTSTRYVLHCFNIVEKFDEHEVYKYNVGLGSILTLVKKQIAHRIANIELRRHQKQKEREHRAQLIEANDKITE